MTVRVQKQTERRSSCPMRCMFHDLIAVLLCLLAASMQMCLALPTHYASDSVSYDSRVAELRGELRDVYHLEMLPDPPLELGIHTPCRKFGRGCPDTYVAFLEHVVSSLRLAEDAIENEGSTLLNVSLNVNAHGKRSGKEKEERPLATKPPVPVKAGATSSASLDSPLLLRLPVQTSWPYADFKRLENLLVCVKVAESQLGRSGIAARELQHQYGVPRSENLVLQDDFGGKVSAHLSDACASLGRTQTSSQEFANRTAEEADLYKAWCRYIQRRRERQSAGAQASFTEGSASLLANLPSVPLACHAVDARRWYAEVLLLLDPLCAFLVSFTLSVALPSAFATAVVLWVWVGDGWGAETENTIFNATKKRAPEPEEMEDAVALEDAHAVKERLAEQNYSQGRLAGLRFTFLACVQHRSRSMRFLKLRLVLCLLVAADLLWSFVQVLYVNLWPSAESSGPFLTTSINFLFGLLPTWIRVVVNVYVIAVLQGAVLIMALKGAAIAYADWQDFVARCATEQEYLLKAMEEELTQ